MTIVSCSYIFLDTADSMAKQYLPRQGPQLLICNSFGSHVPLRRHSFQILSQCRTLEIQSIVSLIVLLQNMNQTFKNYLNTNFSVQMNFGILLSYSSLKFQELWIMNFSKINYFSLQIALLESPVVKRVTMASVISVN